ncbi:MAG: efflux RND transporter periplasmic adaptor subunit [Candidatus Acidiferrales bacterium]
MDTHRKLLLACTAILLVSIVAVRTYAWDADDEQDKEAAVTTPSHVSVEKGQTVITLDTATQERMGLATAAAHWAKARAQARAAATILSAQELLSFRNRIIAAQAQMEKAQASVDVSAKEYQRLKDLYDRNQDTSQKSVEAAEGALRTDRASLAAARQGLALQKFAAQQSWGLTVARWVSNGSKSLDQVLGQRLLLVQVALPPERAFRAPARITLSTSSGQLVEARYVSPLPRTQSLTQRASLLYVVTSRPSLAPGMNLIARLPEGPIRRGIVIPHSAIVWWQGEAWAYRRIHATRFVRKRVSTETPLPKGYFVTSGFKQGDEIVTRGAQFLLSEEFRSEIQPED